ncbi:NAD(P)/FAD-dependent oxidoreductase [Actinoplanes sp. NPDC049802]|uniref:phytoene desaturase family protein n=1 Tax=Actinoplanes sp. NPDC049802 TaxID=3154742 RepID=UPI0033FD9F33
MRRRCSDWRSKTQPDDPAAAILLPESGPARRPGNVRSTSRRHCRAMAFSEMRRNFQRAEDGVVKSPRLQKEMYDAVIVGAGHNGLVCAARLARAGRRVAIVERRDVVGGACVTEELIPGHRFSTASVVTALFPQDLINDLDLAGHGLEIVERDPSVTALFPGGRTLTLGADEAANATEIGKFSTRDAKAYAEFGRTMRRLAQVVEPYLTGPSRTPLFRDIPALRTALSTATALSDEDLRLLVTALFGSARELLDEWFESDEVKVPLCTEGTTGFDGGPSAPGSAYLMLYHQLTTGEWGRPAWGHVRGGMGGITRALAADCRRHGVDIITGRPVTRIRVGSDGAEAVELSDGGELTARAIVSAADPRTTFERLVDADAVPVGYRSVITGALYPGIAAKLHLALDRLPRVRGLDDAGPNLRGTIMIIPSLDHLDRIHAEARRGRAPDEPQVECTIPSVLDPGLAPPGGHVMSMYLQYVPHTLAGAGWDETRESYIDRVLEYVEPYLPGLTAAVVGRKLDTPADLERVIGLPGGNLYHGVMSPLDLFAGRPVAGLPDYHTPVPRLYLCGSGTRPGGGVFGVPGRNASDVVLRELEDGHDR